MQQRVRTVLGGKQSEGVRLLWRALQKRGWSQEDLRRALGKVRGVVGRWLYGDRVPGLEAIIKMRDMLDIPIESWKQTPKRPIRLPGHDLYEGPRAA